MLINLFEHLSRRLKKENNLSDLTWAMAKTSPSFLDTFMAAFKFQSFTSGEPVELDREVQTDDSRPDFIAMQGKRRFVIENKIWDRKHHFAQYAAAFGDAERAIISAYNLSTDEIELANKYNFRYITWKEMIDLLENNVNGATSGDEDMIMAYTKFVREVCSIMELKLKQLRRDNFPMTLDAFNALADWTFTYGFNKDGFTCTSYESNRSCGHNWVGKYGKIIYSKDTPPLYPLLAIDFSMDSHKPSIVIWIEKDWNKYVYNSFNNDVLDNDLFSYNKENEWLQFTLKDTYYEIFFSEDLEKQKSLLLQFLSSVLNEVILRHNNTKSS